MDDVNSTAHVVNRLPLPTAKSALHLLQTPDLAHVDVPLPAYTSTTPETALSPVHDLVAGGVAGSAGIIVGHPLDSLKVRMQMITAIPGENAAPSSFGALLRSAEFGSVWRGLGAPLAAAAVVNASIFLTYGVSTRIWDEYRDERNMTETVADATAFDRNAICGGATGLVSSLFLCPSEHVKTKLQTQQTAGPALYRDSFHAARHILANHGLVGLYRGLLATTARQVPGFVVYFGTYERLKNCALAQQSLGPQHTLLASIAAGGTSGALSWAAAYPMDLIKSRIQALPMNCRMRDRSILHVAQQVMRRQGWRALYRGLGITMVRAFPVNGIIFPTYEVTLKALRSK